MRPPSYANRAVAKTGSERPVGNASWRAGDTSDILGLDHRLSAASPHAHAYIAPGSVLPSLPLPSLLMYVTALLRLQRPELREWPVAISWHPYIFALGTLRVTQLQG
jgi:hypothetical protein